VDCRKNDIEERIFPSPDPSEDPDEVIDGVLNP
jgi:hypothetical protein